MFDYDLDYADKKLKIKGSVVSEPGKLVKGSVALELEVNIIDVLRMAAAKTDNTLDDKLVDMIEAAL